jgi:hypothetical protein
MATKGRSARIKGHQFERQMAEWWRDRGWEKCQTSRYESKMLDDKKVDLTNTPPFSCQCKAVENLGSIHRVLAEMPQDSNINLVFHKKNRQGTIVAMTLEDFQELIDMLKINKII